MLAVGEDVRSGLSTSSYSAYFLDCVASKSSQTSDLLMPLWASVKTAPRADLESQLQLALFAVEDTRSFSSHGQAAQSDALGPLMAINVNLMLVSWDGFLMHLCLYLAPWHRSTLQYSDFMSETLMSSLQEAVVASCEDTTHE